MKKGLLVLVLAVFAAAGAFALPEVSIGGGAYFTSDMGGGYKVSVTGYSDTTKTPYKGIGAFAFMDMTFVEVSLGFFAGDASMVEEEKLGSTTDTNTLWLPVKGIDLGILGKIPFSLSNQLTVFPLLGANYRVLDTGITGVTIAMVTGTGLVDGWLNALWIKAGGGIDYSFSSKNFIRAELLYGIRLKNAFEKEMVRDLKDPDSSEYVSPSATVNSRLGHGITIKLAVGCRL